MENSVGRSWFKDWFDTHYYHILYQNRNHSEARAFIEKLLSYLRLSRGSEALDLACGKGRHSKFLSEHNLKVVGLDLSENSIEEAKKMSNEELHFEVADMRSFSLNKKFDAIFNLFTSFGYFDNKADNLHVLKRVKAHLKADGRLVVDFLNAEKVLKNLPTSEVKTLDGIEFHIDKYLENGIVVKRIRFSDKGNDYEFFERVQALTIDDFREMLKHCGMEIIDTFGDYNLNPFEPQKSDRLILIAH
ncbi:class I SAM-dependent methyltransferase [Halocola ammonii]